MEIVCLECFCEDAYFNGSCYECPDCGHCWSADDADSDEDYR